MFPRDYEERVYAGVLGKIIGVYLGRPFEGWWHHQIMERLGEVDYYVHDKLGVPLIVTDDDISGTFTFLRALPDYDYSRDLTPAQIGQTWLNYLIENRTVLWWGGLGNSTEHTAYLRLKRGIPAPQSGSAALNGQVVSEQIGAQIFIDGWGMVAPGDPELAADLARRAGSVSHDGEAIYGAQVVAAMVAQAFVESDMQKLIDTATGLIPKDSIIYRMIADLRSWREKHDDWRRARELLDKSYGYHIYGGNCHIIPNHGLIILSLLYGDDDFQKTLMIVNTCGWDTDCNSGNVGCIMGVKNGLAGIDQGPDWRGPVADRMYLPTADGGRCITDAVIETYHVVNTARALHGLQPVSPKGGARFHFSLPGSVQGFQADGPCSVQNAPLGDSRALAIDLDAAGLSAEVPARVATATFIPPEARQMIGSYGLIASPTLYPGQTVRARVLADASNTKPVRLGLYISIYGKDDEIEAIDGPEATLSPGAEHVFTWPIPDTAGAPIAQIGVALAASGEGDAEGGARAKDATARVYLDYLTWEGEPRMTLTRPRHGGNMWHKAWTNAVHHAHSGAEPFRLIHDEGRGLFIHGTREWKDYQISADVKPHMVDAAGIAVRVQGMRRYYALLLCRGNKARLVKELDGEAVLAEADFDWKFGETYQLKLQANGRRLQAWIDDRLLFDVEDQERPLLEGAIALVCEEGRTATRAVHVTPV